MGIIEQIKKGEGKTIEFKEIMPSAEKLSKTVISFANMAGGKMIIGVTDKCKIIGIDNTDIPMQMDRISNILHDTIHPMIIPDIYTYTVEEKTLLVIEVYPSPLKPHFLKSSGKADGTYIRVGATNKKADFEYIQELERQRLNISFDEDFAAEQTDNFDFSALQNTLKANLNRKNGIIHRDYSMTGSDIKVAVFDSKIEIISPGCFPKSITLEEVLGGRSEIRNKVIVRIFKEAKKIEQWGRGVQRIIELCESKGLKKPEISEAGMFVKYTFYRKSDANLKISVYASKVLDYLKENKQIKVSETMKLLNLSKSRANDVLRNMLESDIVVKQGSSRATKYVLKE